MVSWECPTNPREASGLDPEAVHEWVRTNGDHAILRWEPPDDHEADARTVPVPLHDELSEGTLKKIGELAGMKDFQEFKAWIDRNA
jgi:predicted RNA binding protein YcfA (HicA-like mRNA interferase family)